MRDCKEFFVLKDDIMAFADVLSEYELKNGIGYSTGDGISVTVWYDESDGLYSEYIEKLEALNDD